MKKKEFRVGGRLIRLLARHGYYVPDPTGRTNGVFNLTKLVKTETVNSIKKWRGILPSDIVDLNELLKRANFEPLKHRIFGVVDERDEIKEFSQFGKKIIDS